MIQLSNINLRYSSKLLILKKNWQQQIKSKSISDKIKIIVSSLIFF